MLMKRIYIICVFALMGMGVMRGVDFTDESLDYQIVYHWGVLWKHAANATIEIKDSQKGHYDARLYARTLSWVDKVYDVRDTLYATIDKKHFVPIKYMKATHEKGRHSWDIVEFAVANGVTSGHCTRIRPGKDKMEIELSTQGDAYDMLSVFYMLRRLDMGRLEREGKYETTIFSGKRKERLEIKYVGVEDIELRDKSIHNAYHIKFSFTEEGKTKSSDDIDTWISTDEVHIPLMLRGSLPIGEVRVYYKR